MNDRFYVRYFNKNTKEFEYHKIGAINTKPYTDCTIYEEGQFCTGIHDKNGKFIYEGDIAKYVSKNRSKDFNVEIKYLDNIDLIESDWLATGYFCVDPNSNLSRCDILTSETALDYEVIGNIYENKELLEVKDVQF